MINPIKPNISL